VAGFQVSISGRFWVSTEDLVNVRAVGDAIVISRAAEGAIEGT